MYLVPGDGKGAPKGEKCEASDLILPGDDTKAMVHSLNGQDAAVKSGEISRAHESKQTARLLEPWRYSILCAKGGSSSTA